MATVHYMRLSGVAKVIDRTVLFVAAACIVARQYDVPSKAFWVSTLRGREYLVLVLIGIISFFGVFTPFDALVARSRVARRTALRQQILAHFGRLLMIAGRAEPPIEVSDLGLHVWRVRRGRLARVATYRLGMTPATRPFAPRRGVGVVGLCWQRNGEVSVDVEQLALHLRDKSDFATYRVTHGADAVMGLSWPEFVDVRHRGAVFAAPIRNGRHAFVGCVSVDAGRGYTSLDNNDLWHQLNSLCVILGQDGFRSL